MASPAKVDSIQYDPNRTARIALLFYVDGEKRYIVAPDGLTAGDTVLSGPEAPANVGNCLPMSHIPLGTTIHNIELREGRGGVLCRSAGTSATLMARDAEWAQISLPSGEIRRIPSACRATIGSTGNSDHMGIVLGKAGSQALDGSSATRSWHGDESGGSSARRWRRSHQGWPSSGQPRGQASQGWFDSQETKSFEQCHCATPSQQTIRTTEIKIRECRQLENQMKLKSKAQS